ncbi:MAG: acyl-CoA thioesterase [Planctomycetota bacterium]|jgi:acyl-CoA thioester hydrolase
MRGPFVHTETLRWNDADLQGVVNNAVFLTLLEQARFAYFDALGLLRGRAFPFLLGSTNIRFVRPARPGMTVQIEARVTRLGTKSFDMSYRVVAGGETLAEAGATLVWIEESLRSVPIPAAARRLILEHEDLPLG